MHPAQEAFEKFVKAISVAIMVGSGMMAAVCGAVGVFFFIKSMFVELTPDPSHDFFVVASIAGLICYSVHWFVSRFPPAPAPAPQLKQRRAEQDEE
jgi:hypothetical protein